MIPPRCAEQPVRITCRQLRYLLLPRLLLLQLLQLQLLLLQPLFVLPRPESLLHSPPLSEGEGLACRVLQVSPTRPPNHGVKTTFVILYLADPSLLPGPCVTGGATLLLCGGGKVGEWRRGGCGC